MRRGKLNELLRLYDKRDRPLLISGNFRGTSLASNGERRPLCTSIVRVLRISLKTSFYVTVERLRLLSSFLKAFVRLITTGMSVVWKEKVNMI